MVGVQRVVHTYMQIIRTPTQGEDDFKVFKAFPVPCFIFFRHLLYPRLAYSGATVFNDL